MEERLMRLLREVAYILKRIRRKKEPCGTQQVRGSEGERLSVMKQLICRNDRYEVNHYSGSSEMPNQVERRRSKMERLRVSKASGRWRWQRQDTC